MQRQSILVCVMVLLTACISQATVIDNPGFEYDGTIYDIETTAPSFWAVNTNAYAPFGGTVIPRWSSEGSYSLALSSHPYMLFSQGDYISVSQDIDLTKITDIMFDVRLDTTYNDPFDPGQRQAKVLLNGDTYWASTGTSPDIRGEYFDESIDVSGLSGVYNLELRLESQVAEFTYINYQAYWDNLRAVQKPQTPPVADADGPYVIYVGDTLTLDASGSADDGNDIVSYVWDLDDDNSFETDAGLEPIFDVNYTYLESLGLLVDNTYAIHLKVTDSENQSDIADSTLTIISLPVIEAAVDIKPNTLNLKSKGRWITCNIWLPEGYDVADVNSYSVTLEDEIEAEWIWFHQDQQVVMARFNRPALQQILLDIETPADVELLVSGQLNDGTLFEGTDTIKLIEKTPRSKLLRSGKLAPLRKF